MGNSLGCVKEPKEQAAGPGKAPLSPQKRVRFKRKRRGKKRTVPEANPKEQPLPGTEIAEDDEAVEKFKVQPQQEGGEEIAKTLHQGTSQSPDPNPSSSPEALPQGLLVQVKERFQGEVQKAQLVVEHWPSGSGGRRRFPEEGTTVIARLLDNPAEKNCEKAVSRLVEFQRTGAGSSRAVLLPLQRDAAVKDYQRKDEDQLVSRCNAVSREEPAGGQGPEKPAALVEAGRSPEAWDTEGNESISSATWTGSWFVEPGTISELSTPSPMVDQVENQGFEKSQRLSLSREKPALKGGEGTWTQPGTKLPASQSDSSFSGPTTSTAQPSSGYGSDSSHQPTRDIVASQISGSILEDGCTLPAQEDSQVQRGRTEKAVKPSGGKISDIYISGESGDMSAKEKLLLWTQKVTAGYVGVKCTNFSSCWSDGKMFNALIHRYRPDMVDMERVQIQSNRENLEQAFEVAERLGVTRLLDAEDVDVPSPDEKSVITYVSSIYDAFPKVPEGGDGISAIEVDSRWLEYQNRVDSLIPWIKQHTILMSDTSFPQNPVELKALYNQYIHFKETEIPTKEQEKGRIEELYKLLEVWIEFGRIKLPQGYHPNDVEEEWGKLIIEMLEREKSLRPAVERLELLLQIANKIQNGALSCEEKLTLARNTLQADAAHLESGQPVQYESDVVTYLQECEGLIRQLQVDVQILRDENYYQLEELAFRIVRLQDELVTLRLECTNLYRKGHFSTLELVQPSTLTTTHLKAEPLTKGTHTSSTSWFRKPMTRAELVAISSSEDEGNLRFVYELLSWVEEMQMKLERAEWGSDLPSVESQLETQRHVHSSVEDLGASVKEARMYEGKMSQNFRTSYTETLGKLETQYCKLMETSSFRLRHLQSLYGFVSRATAELIWLNEKEEEELAYDWSDNNPNIAAKRNYFSELTMELEEKQDVFRSLQDTAELLSLENHPAKQTVEAYSAAVQSQWQWIKQLCLCVDQHVKENAAYFQFFSDARESETYLRNLQDSIKRKYSCDQNTSLTRLEDLLQDSMDEKEQLIQSKSSVASLVGRSKTIVQLKPRNPDHVLKSTISVKAVCDYRQIEITICKNDECVLEDNSQRTKWKVISPTGNEAMVPSVCFLIPPPNKEAIDIANRVEQLYQKVMALWHQLHVNTKSLISWNYLRKDIALVQGWNMEKLRSLAQGECQQAMKSLQAHCEDFLQDSRDSELFSGADRLRLEEEVKSSKEHFQQLLESMENEDKDETLARTYLSELKNIRLRLEECEQRLVRRIQAPSSTRTDGDTIQENTLRIAEQERVQEDLRQLKSDLQHVSERCDSFLHKSPTGSSAPHLRSELNLLVEKMDHVYGLSSIYLDKLKMVDVIVRGTQGAESLVKGYEVKLSQEEAVPADLTAIQSHRATLQQWLSDSKNKNAVFSSLEEDVAKAKATGEQLYRLKQERSMDLERYQEKGAQLWDRWQRVGSQIETRCSDLESIQEVLRDYRECHGELIQWIEETTAQQELMKPGQAEDSRVLSEQLSQQTALVVVIDRNQAKLDQCQKFSQQYSAAVKDYELQLMTYRAFVESQQKSPVKRRRMLSSSDAITQEFMDLRTRYTALVTLTTQHVKYISDALRRLEEEEKAVEEEKQEHVDKVKELLGWVSGLKQSTQVRTGPLKSKELGDIEKSISEQQALNEELASRKEQVSEAIKTAQIFLAKHSHKLSDQEKEQISTQLSALKETYHQLCSDSAEQLQQLQSHLAQETEHKTLQEQQAMRSQKLEELCTWLGQVENTLTDQQRAADEGDLPMLQQRQSDVKDLQRNIQNRAASFAGVLKATEEFLEANRAKMNPGELAALQEKLRLAKEQFQSLQERTEVAQKELESAVTAAVQQETEKVKAAKELEENRSKIESLLNWVTSLEQTGALSEHKTRPMEQGPGALEGKSAQDILDGHLVEVDGVEENLDRQYERLKARHQELLSQQQDVILATQTAQAFLDKQGHNLAPEEKQRLQGRLAELKEQYAANLSQSEKQLKQVQALRDELQKFLRDHGEFAAWLEQAEQELERMHKGDSDPESLRPMLLRQGSFSEDVISHKGDLRFVTMSGQKVLDAERVAKEEGPEPLATGNLVKSKLDDATKRYTALHSKCAKLGSHLNTLLDRYQQFQEVAETLRSWLQESEAAVAKVLSETVSSDPAVLQKQLTNAKHLQGDLAEHQVPVEKLQKAARSLLEIEGEPAPDRRRIQETTDSIVSHFQSLSGQMAERSDLLQKSIAQSQSVQEGLENLLQSMAEIEKSLEGEQLASLSSLSVQESLATNTKLKQDIARQKSSLEATREMVTRFMETADSATASALQGKLAEVTEHFNKLCQRQQEKENVLKGLLPKVEQYEHLSEKLQQFTESRARMLASGNQPDRDIAHFSQQIQELNLEMRQHQEDLDTLEGLTTELSSFGFPVGSSQHQEKVHSLKQDFVQLQKAAKEREKDASSCQEQLDEFRKLVGTVKKWLKESEGNVPSAETSLGTQELEKRMRQIQVLLEEWTGKGAQVEEINRKGTALENLIVEITAPDAQSKTGSVLPALGVSVGSVNGYHTCKDLTEIQCDMSDVNQQYEGLGMALRERQEQLSAMLKKIQEVQEEASSVLKWLESKERTLSALEASSSPTKTETMRAQAEHNKAFLAELEQNSGKIQKVKEALSGLLEKCPDSPEAANWKKMLDDLNSRWARANQVTAERQQKLEKSANQLASFQAAEAQLRPWLMEKELMMSVLGPLSIDPNMLNAQKQQVQFMLKEFEARRQQHEQLNQAAQGILSSPGDGSPSSNQVREELQGVNQKWTELTERLNSRSSQIDQAIVKSIQYQELLQDLSEKVKAVGQRLSSQSAVSTQPDAVKQQLEETSEIRSDLGQLEEEIMEAQTLCDELSVLIGEQYLKDELRKRLETVALPLKGLEDLAADRMNRLQTALASSQQFQHMFDELRTWLDDKLCQQAQSRPISANLERLQCQIQEQEEFQKNLNQHSGSYEMIVAEGESLLLSVQPGEEKTALQSQLVGLKTHWDELSKQTTDRNSRLKDCLQKAQKYQRHMEDLLPWVEDCRAKMSELEVTLDPVQLEAALLRSKAMLSDVEKRRSLLEMLNSAADILIDACQTDEDEVRDEKAGINQKMDAITEELQAKTGCIEEMSQRLKEFQENFKNIEKKLEGAKHQLEIYDALGPQACSNKNLEKLKAQQEVLQALEPQVDYLKNFTQGLVEDAPDGSDCSQLLRQAEDSQQDFKIVKQKVNECCTLMETKLEGIGQFNNHVREMFSQLADLDDELDSMGAIGRDIDSLQSQAEDVRTFLGRLQGLKSDIEASEEECRHMLEDEGSPDLLGLKRELETLNKQCSKLTERGKNRQEQVETTLSRVEDFYSKLKELNHMASAAEENEALQWIVGTEVETINQQLADFKMFQKEQVDPIQVKLQQVNGLGQGLIQSAGKNCDVQGLEHDMEEINARWNTLNKKVAQRIAQLQEALLHCGKFQDALEPLLSWLVDTEELISNQKPPSAEYKVVKAQIQEQKLLQRLLDDRKATVEMIQAEGGRIAQSAEPTDREKIVCQLESLENRWAGLLGKAAARQKQLEDILILAKQFHETTEPISDWLSLTEKKLANSEPIGTQTAKIQQQITRHKALAEDIESRATDVNQAVSLGQSLASLSCIAEQGLLAEKLDSLRARYSEVQDRCCRKAALLDQALSNARLFGEDEVEVLNWLAEVEDKLSLVFVKDYKRDVLQKQHADQLALNEEIVNRKKNVDQAIKNGQALLKQTTGEEVLLIQEKLDGIKTRYSDITATSSKALRTLEQARQLATKFQSTHEELTSWMSEVEEELLSSGGQSPVGEQIPQFQQRQKELKKEVMEHRLVLDTVNEVSRALLELVPWRAREGLDKLVSDTNEQYKMVSDTIRQRVDEIDAAIQRSQQYEQAADAELAWVAETKRKLMALGPIRLEQDQTTAQLQVQKAFSIDIIRHKDSMDELFSQRNEIFGTCGEEQKALLQEKTESLVKQYDAVSQLNSERYACLERAQVLVNQFWETYEELNPWIEETQALIAQLPPPAIDYEQLKQQQEDMRQLRESIAEHKPHIDKLLKIGPQLKELNPEEGAMVQEKYLTAEAMYARIKEEVRQRALALDEAVSQSTQIAEFHDKIEPMLETLENLSSRLRMPPVIPAEVDKIRECISENKNSTMELEKLQPTFEALKRRGEELIGRSQGADKDLAAKEIQDKLNQMVFFWEDIKAQAEGRESKFLDVLELAEKFWYEMATLLTTVKETQDIVHDLESPGIDPSIIKQQVEAAETIKEETDGVHEELEFIRVLGAELIMACGETEKPEVKKSIDEMNNAWENLNKTWKERLEKLEEAMQSAVQYQDTLQAMFDWLDNTVIKLCNMPPVGTDLNTVKEQLNEMKEFKMEVYQQQIEMEKLNHQGELMLKKATDETDRDIIREPLTELKHLWENLGEKIAHRQHKLETALLALGQFQHALAELMAWLTHTEELLDAQKPINGDPRVIEVELAKHHVLKNDVLAHQATVETVNKAGNELLESSAGDDASSLRNRLEKLNSCWESVLQKTEEREQQLQSTLQQAQGFHGEIEDFLLWLTRMESQLSASKPTGGLPETAREQLNAHMELYAQLKANEEVYSQLLAKGRLILLSRDDSGSGSKTEQSVTLLEQKWNLVSTKMEERKSKLEDALNQATEFQNSLQDFINWLTLAEQSLNIAPPPSLILNTVLSQIDEHKVFANEVNAHRDRIIELDQTGNQLKFLSQKQDVVLIKNLLVSVQSRWEKVVQRSVDRGRALDDARKRAKQFHEAWKKLVDWLEDAENHLDSELEISNDPDKIKLQLSKHKEFQKTLGGKQPVYDTTIRTGRALKEKAVLPDDTQKLDNLLGEVRDKWDTVCGKSVERQHKLEEALLFSGQFMDALQALVDWLYKVEPQLAEDQPVHGDLDLVMNLMDAHKVFQKELGKRTGTVQVLKRSGRELIENSRDDTTWVKGQLQELSNRWDTVCKLSVSKQTRLEQALKQAEEFRTAVHMLLEWLSEAEQTLRFRGALPDDAEALQSLIDIHKEFMKKVEEKRVDVNAAVGMGEVILAACHPDCITTIKHWITIIRARFEEVLTWAQQHQQRLETALSELVANAELLEELLAWIQWAETTLIQRDQEPMPQNIDQVKALISEHQFFMEEMTRKQPDVDRVTKTYKRKATEPAHGPFIEKSRSNRKSLSHTAPPPMPVLSQSETKNPRINQLSARWQQVWLLALERQRKLNDALDRLEELKEFANFDFDIWRKKYMRWMNHKKSRVMDFFRRIDKDQDGKITRQEFIDGILASKFPTTKLEMTAVADIFDRDGDGYIDYYEFVAALHPNKDAYRPTTDADKIEDEVTRQVAQCKCAKRFQVEQIGENKYRFFLGNQFGDSQQLRLVRILRSTVMVRVGGGWMALDEFLVKNDPCRVHHPGSKIKRSDSSSSIASQSPIARGRTNLELREKFILPEGASQGMTPFRSRGRRSKPSSRAASPTRSSSSASQSNHSCTSMPSSPAAPASGTKTPHHFSRCYDKPWLVNSKAGTPHRGFDNSDSHLSSSEVTPSAGSKLKRPTFHSSRTSLAGDTSNNSSPVSTGAKTNRADPKKTASRPTSRAGSRAGSRASSRRGSDASDFDLLETQSACSDTSESSMAGGQGSSRRGLAKPSKIPTMSKKTTTATPKTPGPKR
ncbi:microtubule-actin cross-linking factor 1 isoform X14 [Trachemys scripta elegans]|uniref:microtubule-actin cross-linking factor 1 isoform X14 n=1 Tax=Trachemys scripta elegans TaxID=31138 RepID=UPI001556CB0B|nr:microtubule-actin cross-linking factor 1 isoform X14 [Trachemys scripta elegans]